MANHTTWGVFFQHHFALKDHYRLDLLPWFWACKDNSEACFLVTGSWCSNDFSSGFMEYGASNVVGTSSMLRMWPLWIPSCSFLLAKFRNLLLLVILQLLAHSGSRPYSQSILESESVTPAQTTNKINNIHLLYELSDLNQIMTVVTARLTIHFFKVLSNAGNFVIPATVFQLSFGKLKQLVYYLYRVHYAYTIHSCTYLR